MKGEVIGKNLKQKKNKNKSFLKLKIFAVGVFTVCNLRCALRFIERQKKTKSAILFQIVFFFRFTCLLRVYYYIYAYGLRILLLLLL